MFFVERVAKELIEETSTVRFELQIDRTRGCLTLRERPFINGEELHTWVFSVLARDLAPHLTEVTEPDSSNVRNLNAVCALYRDAINGIRLKPGQAPHQQRFVRLSLPLKPDVSDKNETLESFRGFLTAFGAKSPTLDSPAIEDLLGPLRAALGHASGVQAPSNDGKVIYRQSAALDEHKLLLIRESQRPGFSPDRWTFELLSLDVSAVTCRALPGCGLWDVTLPSVERLETTVWQIRLKSVERWWYTSILFSDQIRAQQFATACTTCVPQLRERLHHANYEA